MKKRIDYYDAARGMGVIFVIIGHIGTFYVPFRQFVTSFHMALFFIISGMLMQETGETEKPFWNIVKKKFVRIMVPYYLFSIVSILIEACKIIWKGTFYLPHLQSLTITTLTLYGNSVMWFLPALFLSQLLFLGIRKIALRFFYKICNAKTEENAKKAACLVEVVTIVSFIIIVLYMIWYNIVEQAFYAGHAEIEKYKHIHEIVGMIIRSCFCTIFICVGYYVRKYLLVKGRPIHLSAAAVILLLLICLIMNRIIPGVDLRSMFWGNAKERIWIVNYYVTEYLKAGLYVAGASCGAIGIILLCKIWGELRQGMLFRGLLFLGNNSLTIMVTHLDFHILHFGVIFANFINVYTKSSFAYHLCLLMFMFAAEIVLVRFINRFLPSVVGKKQK